MERVAVFLDYENVHRTGHQLYGSVGQPKYDTVVDPVKIAEVVVAKRRTAGELTSIRVFRGRPVPEFQSKPASANDLQAAAWVLDSRVQLKRRDLKYEFDADRKWVSAREKGIDVALAVSLVEGSLKEQFDVAIVFSCDTDLLPAVELAYRDTAAHIEVACWSGSKPLWFPEGLRMSPPRRMPYCHFLSQQDFLDCRDYSAV
ncbi:NYN domain-containing protein [Herbiconiux sp. VKM Ac-2851]|uniref:NYN domain-containing protein n=1 Tax=Herbiconiux sp. VKM Ac-2851 TaxID=2739025 RepID=UPI001566F1E0|nr:NYN domain-containing protein [Herbiconiux sp. VKM Ac-2851]NQX33282.1 NYN domain-containing protein [Herbiconiux sp. VKM Ac-2851]